MPPRRPVAKKDASHPAPTPKATSTAAADETQPAVQAHLLTVPLPDQPGACNFIVEFPGYIKNEDRALATFGGLDGLAAQRQNHPKTLQLRLRPGDPSCHPLISDDAKTTTVLVLKLTRSNPAPLHLDDKMQTGDLDSEDDEDSLHDDGVKAEIIAVADKTYAFSAPADFQYAGQDRRPLEVQWVSRADRVEDDPEFLPRQPLLCTPSMFAVEPAVDYAFKQYKAAEHGLDVLGRKPKRGTGITWVDYFAKEVPSADTKTLGTGVDTTNINNNNNNNITAPSQGGQRSLAPGIEALITRLELLFSRRPVYLESALGVALGTLDGSGGGSVSGASALAATERGTITATTNTPSGSFASSSSSSFPATRSQQELLSKICYRFKNGPWKGTWVLRGYDPRAEPAARQYQVLEYSLPVEWWKKVLTHKNRLHRQLQQLQLHNTIATTTTATATATATNGAGGGSTTGAGGGLAAASGLPPIAATYTSLCSFTGVQSTQTIQLQLCDIDDTEVRSVLAETSNVAAGVNDASGWLTQPAWEGIKSKVATRFGALWDTATAQAVERGINPPAGANGAATAGGGGGIGGGVGIIPPELMSGLASYLEKKSQQSRAMGSAGGRSRGALPTAGAIAEAAVGNRQRGQDAGIVDVAPIESIEAMEEEEEEEEEDLEEDEEDDDEDDEEEEDE